MNELGPDWATDGFVYSHTGPASGPSSEHFYTVKLNVPGSGVCEYGPLRLANVRWSDEWDTLPVPIGAAVWAWCRAGRVRVVVFGLAEQLLPCGEQPGAGSLVPGETGEIRQPVPPPSGGFTQTSVSAPDGGGEGGVG